MVFEAKMCVMLTPGIRQTPFTSYPRTKVATASAWLPLLYDTVVIALTIYRACQTRSPGYFRSTILQAVLAGGILYYM